MNNHLLNKKIGEELISLINKDASVVQISRWADEIYSNYCRELEPEVDDLITKISFMQHGSEFEISKETLKSIAHKLINMN